MKRRDLDVFDIAAAIWMFVLDTAVRKLHAVVDDRQVVLACPFPDLAIAPSGPSVAVRAVAVSLLQEPLILALQLVIEDDSFDPCSLVTEAFGNSEIRSIHLRIVG